MSRRFQNRMTQTMRVRTIDFETGEVELAESGYGTCTNIIGKVLFRNGGRFDTDAIVKAKKMTVTIELGDSE